MPDRAIIPLLPAVSLGFICGIIAATLQLEGGARMAVAVAGIVAVILAGVSSVFGTRGDGSEKAAVGALRAACAVGLFICIYLFILGFLGGGSMVSLIWLPLALACGIAVTRFEVRDRETEEQQQQTA
jgi:ascorbate-specific PTS system EIIC-type component UlaA